MPKPADAITLVRFVRGDFKDAWNRLSGSIFVRSRGNFMFGKQAMVLLELACRICESDATKRKIASLSQCLARQNKLYFRSIPDRAYERRDISTGSWRRSNLKKRQGQEFDLPSLNDTDIPLIWLIFDLIRNGQAHQYEQVMIRLNDGNRFGIGLAGASFLRRTWLTRFYCPKDHFQVLVEGDILFLKLRTDRLFNEISNAIDESRILSPGLDLSKLERKWDFSLDELRQLLAQ